MECVNSNKIIENEHDFIVVLPLSMQESALHNFAIRERDPFYDTYGGVGPRVDPPLTEHEAEGPRAREGNAAMKQRRDEWARALKRAGLYRRTRRN